MDYSRPVLNRSTWGLHINSARFLDRPPEYPDWLNLFQQKEWQDRGFVAWDATNRAVTHLYASYALRIPETLRGTDTWKTGGFTIGSPAYQIQIPNTGRKSQLKKRGSNPSKKDGN